MLVVACGLLIVGAFVLYTIFCLGDTFANIGFVVRGIGFYFTLSGLGLAPLH
jgi:hypothetical protein